MQKGRHLPSLVRIELVHIVGEQRDESRVNEEPLPAGCFLAEYSDGGECLQVS